MYARPNRPNRLAQEVRHFLARASLLLRAIRHAATVTQAMGSGKFRIDSYMSATPQE